MPDLELLPIADFVWVVYYHTSYSRQKRKTVYLPTKKGEQPKAMERALSYLERYDAAYEVRKYYLPDKWHPQLFGTGDTDGI